MILIVKEFKEFRLEPGVIVFSKNFQDPKSGDEFHSNSVVLNSNGAGCRVPFLRISALQNLEECDVLGPTGPNL